MNYLLPDKVYQILKWVALIVLPALATFVGVVGTEWGMPYCDQIVKTITATGTFIGALIGASHLKAKIEAEK